MAYSVGVEGNGYDYKTILIVERVARRQVSRERIPTAGSTKGRIKIAEDFGPIPVPIVAHARHF